MVKEQLHEFGWILEFLKLLSSHIHKNKLKIEIKTPKLNKPSSHPLSCVVLGEEILPPKVLSCTLLYSLARRLCIIKSCALFQLVKYLSHTRSFNIFSFYRVIAD